MARFNLDNYVDVQERINQFWSDHPTGSIVTRLMSPPESFDMCRYSAEVYVERTDDRPAATGYAYEWRATTGNGPNVTSHEENCETSAIGRALANMGYAKNRDERPSQQEMGKANREDTPQTHQNGPGAQLPPRPASQGQNVVPNENGAPPPQARAGLPATEKQFGMIGAQMKRIGWTDDDIHGFAGVESLNELDRAQVSSLIDALMKMEPGTAPF